MRITCNKCLAVYEIDNSLIPQEGKKVRCSNCGEIFVCFPEEEIVQKMIAENVNNVNTENFTGDENIESDESIIEKEEHSYDEIVEETNEVVNEPKNSEFENDIENEAELIEENLENNNQETLEEHTIDDANNDIKDIFQRLSEQTEELFQQEQNMAKPKLIGIKVKHLLGLQNIRFRRLFIFSLLVVFLLLLYYFRYPLTRKFPFMEQVYAIANVKSVIPGEGLEFQNITRHEFEEDYVNKIEVKGFIANNTDRKIRVPIIRLETLDKDARVLHEQYEKSPVYALEARGKVAFSIIITKPSPLSKYVYLTFIDKYEK